MAFKIQTLSVDLVNGTASFAAFDAATPRLRWFKGHSRSLRQGMRVMSMTRCLLLQRQSFNRPRTSFERFAGMVSASRLALLVWQRENGAWSGAIRAGAVHALGDHKINFTKLKAPSDVPQ
jgi:hypothetical protein